MTWGSSTYGYSLMTGKPAIIVDLLGVPWSKEVLSIIKRRYFFVRTRFDERNGVSLVRQDLDDALQSLKCPEIVHKKLEKSQESFNALMR